MNFYNSFIIILKYAGAVGVFIYSMKLMCECMKFISEGYTNTSEPNIRSAHHKIENFSERGLRMFTFLKPLKNAGDEKKFNKYFDRIHKHETITNRMEYEIANFLTIVSEGDLSKDGFRHISSMLKIIDNLESIGNAIYPIAIYRKNKLGTAIHFDRHLKNNLNTMHLPVQKTLEIMNSDLQSNYNNIDLDAANMAEKEINAHRDQLRAEHLNTIRLGTYNYEIGSVYSGLLYALNKKNGYYTIYINKTINNSRKTIGN